MMEWARIVAACVGFAVAYGIAHDLVTAHICVEYFTIGHPDVFRTRSPTLLAVGWGVLATWWVGLGLGLLLAASARAGSRPPLVARDLMRPLAALMTVMAVSATVAGVAGGVAARVGVITLGGDLSYLVPRDRHVAFLADASAHLASYAVAMIGGIVVCVYAWRRRAGSG